VHQLVVKRFQPDLCVLMCQEPRHSISMYPPEVKLRMSTCDVFGVCFHGRFEECDTVIGHKGNQEGFNPFWTGDASFVSLHSAISRSKSKSCSKYGIQTWPIL